MTIEKLKEDILSTVETATLICKQSPLLENVRLKVIGYESKTVHQLATEMGIKTYTERNRLCFNYQPLKSDDFVVIKVQSLECSPLAKEALAYAN